ncbi:MAG: hypothetical protein GWP91_14855 [Rhodobacterales bacterium]|nr:hypothetical protein [Rhodobacterales bacterium]
MRHLLPLALCLALFSCKGPSDSEDEQITNLPNEPGGNPLVPGEAMYPFPSDFYLSDDANSRTGQVIDIPAEALPGGIVPETFTGIDGWSRAPLILAHFEGGVDAASLPDPRDEAASVSDSSPAFLVRADTQERIPVLIELDVDASPETKKALILRAHQALEPATTYVVIIRDLLQSADGGGPLPTSEAFRALRDGVVTDSNEVETQRDDFVKVNEAIAAQNLQPEEVVLAWSFTTRSREQVVNPLLSMTDQMMAATLAQFVVDTDELVGQNREIRGHVEAPNFIGPEGTIVVDDDDRAVQQGVRDVPFLVTIPETVDETRPTVLYGHGFFSHMDEPTWGSLQGLIQPGRVTMVSTNFIGFNENDQFEAFAILADLNRTDEISAMQMQSEAHFVMLSRLVKEQMAGVITENRGSGDFPVMTADNVLYMGISNGGTQGLTIMSVAPNIDRGILVVPGGGLMHFLQRASPWVTMGPVLAGGFTSDLDFQVGISLMQVHLDPWDSINFVDHMVSPRFEGRPEVKIVMHEAMEDAQVNNMVTHWIARTAHVPMFVPNSLEPYGVDTIPSQDYDGPAALYIYDEGYAPLPTTNHPPEENGSHGSVRELEVYKDHVMAFIEDGSIVYTCDGACDPD